MSLQDTDPNTTNRIEPTPQAMDQNPTRVSDGTTAITNKQDGSSGAYVSTKDGAIKVNNGTDMLGLFGPDSTGEVVVKIAKAGYDAATAADDQLVFNSGQNTFKIIDTISATFPNTGSAAPSSPGPSSGRSSANTQVPHNYGFVPAFLAYGGDSGVNFQQPQISSGVFSTTGMYVAIFKITATSTYFDLRSEIVCYGPYGGSVSATGPTIKIYVLQETAN
jgi:hypothetical protein